jgi:hypothetical protein
LTVSREITEEWKNGGITARFPKDTILQMATKIKLSQHFSFDLVPELSDTPRTT